MTVWTVVVLSMDLCDSTGVALWHGQARLFGAAQVTVQGQPAPGEPWWPYPVSNRLRRLGNVVALPRFPWPLERLGAVLAVRCCGQGTVAIRLTLRADDVGDPIWTNNGRLTFTPFTLPVPGASAADAAEPEPLGFSEFIVPLDRGALPGPGLYWFEASHEDVTLMRVPLSVMRWDA